MRLFNPFRLLFGHQEKQPVVFDPPVTEQNTLFLGDVHGCAALLNKFLDETRSERAQPYVGQKPGPKPDFVVLGDMIDRGPESAAVLNSLWRLDRAGKAICLRGNHEQMLLDFLDDPVANGRVWLESGGDMTLLSFGITRLGSLRIEAIADALRDALPEGMLDWLKALPHSWMSGTVLAVHAAAAPMRDPIEQLPKDLLWGHPDFLRMDRQDGVWVVHGHTVVDQAEADHGRISVDTGAWRTGRLTAARIKNGVLSFHETS